MMQSDYTTVSSPDFCDGWLGILIGDAIWYPLWLPSQLDQTVKALVSVIGDRAKANNDHNKNNIKIEKNNTNTNISSSLNKNNKNDSNNNNISTNASKTIKEQNNTNDNNDNNNNNKDFSSAYSFLLNETKVCNKETIIVKLEEFGVEEPEDLGELDHEYIMEIVSLVKPAQRKRFLKFLGL